jgi:hypothetical protein
MDYSHKYKFKMKMDIWLNIRYKTTNITLYFNQKTSKNMRWKEDMPFL